MEMGTFAGKPAHGFVLTGQSLERLKIGQGDFTAKACLRLSRGCRMVP